VVVVGALALGAWSRRRPRFAGHRGFHLLWTGATRPWRLDTALAGRLDRAVLVGVPAVVLLLSRCVYTWFAAPVHLLLTLGAWVLFALVAAGFAPSTRRSSVLAAVGGVALLRSALLLAVLSWRGPGRYWFGFWTLPGQRAAYVTVAFAAFCWLFVAVFGALRPAATRRRAAGTVTLAAGAVLLVGGAIVALVGLEEVLTAWNDQLALLPWGLHRILGFCVYLGIPTSLPTDVALLGAVACAVGAALALAHRPRSKTDHSDAMR